MIPAMMIRTTQRATKVQLVIRNILVRINPLLEGILAASSNEMMIVCFYIALFSCDSYFLIKIGSRDIYNMSMNDHHLLP